MGDNLDGEPRRRFLMGVLSSIEESNEPGTSIENKKG